MLESRHAVLESPAAFSILRRLFTIRATQGVSILRRHPTAMRRTYTFLAKYWSE